MSSVSSLGDNRPNFLVIVADDLGYSDIGCFGSEIKTPNIDRLAREGLRFNDYHTAPLCSPTRAMIMSGTDHHLAGMGVMYESKTSDPQRFNVAGHEGYLNHDVAAMPEILQDAGYHTMMSGKWHLGYRNGFLPVDRGFDRSWALLPGCSNHFGWEPAYPGGEAGRPRLPAHLPMLYVEDDKRYMPDPNTSSDASQGFYSSSFYVSNLLSYFKDRARTQSSDRSKPFFAYLPFAAPHWPLQCPSSDRDKYVGQYDDGPDELRIRRLDGLKKSGIVSPEVRPHDVVAKTKEWDAMTDEERKLSARSMEVYAGMVDRIDQEIGAVLKYLDESGEMDNTVIMFFSDNGAEGAAVEARPTLGPSIMDSLRKYYDNSYNNLGNYNSFIWYGPRWAQAATAPHRMFKGWTTEGGIRVPCVIRYPPFTEGRYKRGDIVKSFATCMDLLPTFLELSGAKHPNPSPETPRSKAPFRGRLVYPMRGKSWVPLLCHGKSASDDHNDTSALIYGPMHSIGWEINEKASLRRGSWKIVNNPPSEITQRVGWELYNLSKDLGETTDVSAQHPQILKELLMEWDRYVEETGTIYGPPMRHGSHYLLPDDMVGGDVTEDIRAWMKVGKGKRLGEITEHRPDVDEWRGQWIDRRDPEAGPAPPILPDRV